MSSNEMPLLLIGLNYRIAPIQLRERLAFAAEQIPFVLKELTQEDSTDQGSIQEAALLCTCNRTEIYLTYNDKANALRKVREVLLRYAGYDAQQLEQLEYLRCGAEAALHLMRVATGLDSLVMGENEILGQVRRAAELAQAAGCSGPVLAALFRTAIRAGKRSRAETLLGSEGISVASIVVEMAEQMMGRLNERTALLIGAGKISSLTARALRGAGLRWILISNRTFERAQRLAQQLGGEAVHFDALQDSLEKADIVICSTGAPHTVLHRDAVQRAQEKRQGRSLLIADLAVPRDADAEVATIEGVQLVNIDGLAIVMRNHHLQKDTVCREVEEIAQQQMQEFCRWYEDRQCAAIIGALYQKAENIYSTEVEHALKRMGPLDKRQERILQAMAKTIAGKLLHDPVTRLHELSAEEEIGSYLKFTQELYQLP